MMEGRAWTANRFARPARAKRVIGFEPRRSGPDRHQQELAKQWGGGRGMAQAATGVTRNARLVVQTAQAQRASLLASATAALLCPRCPSSARLHAWSRVRVGVRFACQRT